MSDDDGFVKRPKMLSGESARKTDSVLGRLRQTADNGRAIALKTRFSGASLILRRQGFLLRSARQPDGTYLAWCERIEAPKP